jgi:anti-anti-sigma factor
MFVPNRTCILLKPTGSLNREGGAELQKQLAAIAPEQHNLWLIDMATVDFIDSAGLVALIAGLNLANHHHCRLAICNPSPSVRLIFEITQLDRVFELVDNPAKLRVALDQPADKGLTFQDAPMAA